MPETVITVGSIADVLSLSERTVRALLQEVDPDINVYDHNLDEWVNHATIAGLIAAREGTQTALLLARLLRSGE